MRIARARTAGDTEVVGPVTDGQLHDLAPLLGPIALQLAAYAADPSALDIARPAGRYDLDDLVMLPPIASDSKVLCAGMNYLDHVRESDRPSVPEGPPAIFTRYPGSFVGHGQALIRPLVSTRLDWEGELGVVIGRRCRSVTSGTASQVIAGWTCVNDGSVRDWQRHTSQFTPGKNFDASGSIGPWIVTVDELASAGAVELTTTVNGVVKQRASTSQLIHGVDELIAYCSAFTTLEVGDVIATGTPGGVGYARTPAEFLAPGDRVEVTIEGIGTLHNPVADEVR